MTSEEHRKRAFRIPLEDAKKILRAAMKVATIVRVDELRPGIIRRMPTQKGIDWVLNFILASKHPHIVCIERGAMMEDTYPYFDFGASTMCNRPDYFLWIEVPIPAGEKIIEKYKLKQTQ